jgi:hypothetical protein
VREILRCVASASPNVPLDRLLVRRWLTALGLVATAEEVARRGDDAGNATALIAADSASETVLGIIGSWPPPFVPMPPEPKYHQVLDRAHAAMSSVGGLSPALRTNLRSTHGLRNSVVHHGAVAPAREARLACESARHLLGLLPSVSTAYVALAPGAGIVAGIAALLDAPDLTEQLTLGEQAVGASDATAAADAAARAHAFLLDRLDPPLSGGFVVRPLGPFEKQEWGRVGEVLDDVDVSLSRIKGWVAASAVGVHPTAYRRFQWITGDHVQYMDGSVQVHRPEEPSLADARWAVTQVAEMAFRLREAGALLEGTDADVRDQRMQYRSVGRQRPR